MNDRPRVAIIGCGLIGRKRADALGANPLVACADIEIDRARALSSRSTAACTADWREVVRRDDVDVIIVATINSLLAEISVAALEAGKHVLVEKPAARNAEELELIIAAQKPSGKLVHVGFNHRYHPALLKAKQLHDEGALGEMMFVRGRYGHGGRAGYDREWRADPKLAGGGELIDQGVHLIDLARLFLGAFTHVDGFARTYYWDMAVDDNAFLLLRTRNDKTAALHVSCTEWKNLFSLEIYGRQGKLHAEGLGGSYGLERLAYYRMLPEMGPPETTIWEFPRGDDSWRVETAEFLEDIRLGRKPSATLDDAHAVLTVVGEIYKRSGYDFR
ncbi:MAG TPA: Gfo/Idh/MocA family oxidoreductase [Thermoanaerobaculia bacterium]